MTGQDDSAKSTLLFASLNLMTQPTSRGFSDKARRDAETVKALSKNPEVGGYLGKLEKPGGPK